MKRIISFVVSAIILGCSIGIGTNYILPFEQEINQNLSSEMLPLDLPDQH